MRKRGATFKHRAKAAPGLIAQNLYPEFEVHLRMAVVMFGSGAATLGNFDHLANALDMPKIGLKTKPDDSAAAVVEVATIAMQNIRDRHYSIGRLGASGEERKALGLLVDTSMDYWNRRSGPAFAQAFKELRALRQEQFANPKKWAAEAANRYWDARCAQCGWASSSEYLLGGQPIADTGDYSDLECPMCGSTDIRGQV